MVRQHKSDRPHINSQNSHAIGSLFVQACPPTFINSFSMLFRSLLSTAVLAVSLCADNVSAAKNGRFGQKARDAMNIGKRSANAVKHAPTTPIEDYRFLTNKTKGTVPSDRVGIIADLDGQHSAWRVYLMSTSTWARCTLA